MRAVGLDVVFVVDATGSMGWLIEEVRERIDALAGAVRRLVPVTRFGVVAYRDYDDPEFVTTIEPLSLSTLRVRRFLERLEARGGGDIPEAVDAGLETALERAGWKPEARHVIVILGDAPPHAERMARTLELARAFRERGGTVTAVDVSFDANPRIAAARLGKRVEELTTVSRRGVLPELQQIASAGGGDASTLEADRRAIRRIGVLIFGERWAEQVRPLLGEL
jgi:Mg-chelatase subunit ChlD